MLLKRIRDLYADAYRGLPREVWLLSIAALINRAGTMVLPFLALYMTEQLGMGIERAGLLIGVYGGGSLLGTWVGGQLADRFNPLTIQIASLFLTGLAFMLLGQVTSQPMIAGMLFLIGVVAEAFRPASGAFLAILAPEESRTRAYALMRLAVNVGMTLGPAIGGFLIISDYSLLFWVDGGACIAAAVVIWFFFHGKTYSEAEGPQRNRAVVSPWRDRAYLGFLGGVFLFALMFFQLETAFGIYMKSAYGLVEHEIGLLFSGNTILIILVEMILLRWVERFANWRVLAAGVACAGIGLAMIPFGSTFGFALAAILVFTVGEMLCLPIAYTIASTRAAASNRGAYLGAFGVAFSSAFIVGPPLGSAVYANLGGSILWYLCAPTAVLAAVLFLILGQSLQKKRP